MGVDVSANRLRRKARHEEGLDTDNDKNLPRVEHDQERKSRRQAATEYPAQNYTERRELGIFKIAKSENATPDGQTKAKSTRVAVGPVELSQNTQSTGFVRREVLGIPIWQRGQRDGLAEQVHERVSTPLVYAKKTEEVASSNSKAEKLLASLGKNPTNQDVINKLYKHYGYDDDKVYNNAKKEFGIDPSLLDNNRNAQFSMQAKPAESAAPQNRASERQEDKNIPRAIPVSRREELNAKIQDWFNAAETPRDGSPASYKKVTDYAKSLDREKEFHSLVKERNSYN